jgi:geranylgeranyl pyrophosphate synthase
VTGRTSGDNSFVAKASLFETFLDAFLKGKADFPEVLTVYVASGKHLRPTLLLMAAEYFQVELDCALNDAVALELIHCATLLHDDVLDSHKVRRGRSTPYADLGATPSIALGNLLLGSAFRLASKTAVQPFSEALFHLSRASFTEITTGNKLSELEIENLCVGKTSTLFQSALTIPAHIAKRLEELPHLMSCGREVGLLFQVLNDNKNLKEVHALGHPCGDLAQKRPCLALAKIVRTAGLKRSKIGADQSSYLNFLDKEAIQTVVRTEVLRHERLALSHASQISEPFCEIITNFLENVVDSEMNL